MKTTSDTASPESRHAVYEVILKVIRYKLKPENSRIMLKTSTPEEELLLWCARAHLEGPAADRVHALLQQRLDWNRLVISPSSTI